MKALVRRNALQLAHDRFRTDSERLASAVERALESARVERQRKREEQEVPELERQRVLEPGRVERPAEESRRVLKHTQVPKVSEGQTSPSPTPCAEEWLAEAKRYIETEKYQKARPLLRKAAEAGNADAMYHLGGLYEGGFIGVRGAQAEAKAREWYQKAADAGNDSGHVRLGRVLRVRMGRFAQDYGKARQWYQKAADAGDTLPC